MSYSHYVSIAGLFDFPDPEFFFRAKSVGDFVKTKYPAASPEMELFLQGLPKAILDLQELYTRTFDVQSITTLDIGYVLFGDDYKRAELLANLSREHQKAGTPLRGELADHLANILRLLPELQDVEIRAELVSEIVVPALMLMIREFDEERILGKNKNYEKHYKTLIEAAPGKPTVYCHLLKGLLNIVTTDFNVGETVAKLQEWASRPNSADFLNQIEKEMEIEANANPMNSGQD